MSAWFTSKPVAGEQSWNLWPWLGPLAISLLLSWIFWAALWQGGGIIGGDTYPYYFPQKLLYSQSIKSGEIPLWHPWTGFGYPLVGESQTGVFYPLNFVLYRFLNVSTAYSVNQLVHYVWCALGMFWCARRLGLAAPGAWLAAIVYTYGWFPCRLCLEWAIIGGAWLPWALGSVESYFQTRRTRWLLALSAVLAMQLLAGHFHLAFITQLVVVAFAGWRSWLLWSEPPPRSVSQILPVDASDLPTVTPIPATVLAERPWRTLVPIAIAILAGFGLAGVQLVPTWELKQRSQRAELGSEHDPAYGYIPPWYWTQMFAPWTRYTAPDIDATLDRLRLWSPESGTNKVEAHLYFGLIPFWLTVWALLWSGLGRGRWSPPLRGFPVLGLLALIYTSGWLVPIGNHVPGFSFFHAPGRYGLITTVAVALIAGTGMNQLLQGIRSGLASRIAGLVILAGTVVDLWIVSGLVTYAYIVPHSPVMQREASEVRQILQSSALPARVYAPGQNLCNLLEVSCVPVYLGIGPREYFDPKLKMPQDEPQRPGEPAPPLLTDAKVKWLQSAGVTHVLSFEPLDTWRWPVRFVWAGVDRLLNAAWGRREDLHLYELNDAPGRLSLMPPHANQQIEVSEYRPNYVRVRVETPVVATLIFRDLAFPGWEIRLDGQEGTTPAAMANTCPPPFRCVQVGSGTHNVEWIYRPRSVLIGGWITCSSLFLILALAHLRFWHRTWTNRWLEWTISRTEP